VKPLIIASTRRDAGKTSLLVGLAAALEKRIGYIKPLGDRFLYRKKRLWDYDAALFANVFHLNDQPETMSIGFDHSKLRYMYDRESITREMKRMVEQAGRDKDLVFIECGKDLTYGAAVYLDPLTLSQTTGSSVLIVTGGEEDEIADDLAFLKRFVGADEAHVGGVILNKVKNPKDFRDSRLPEIHELGIPVLGIVPYDEALTTLSASYVADKLFARVIAGESGLGRTIRNVFVGAMSVSAVVTRPVFSKPDKLILTSGDRSDLILAVLEAGGTSCIVLTHDIVPPSNVTAKANEQGIPILLIPDDTYTAAIKVTNMERLLTSSDSDKVALLRRLVTDGVDLKAILAL
jgi:BioD-like phosphotransacetylase family protein